MAEYVFARRFLSELAEWEGNATPRDVALLDDALARVANNPALPSFYDPQQPSYLY